MSYIIKSATSFASTKLTQTGREKLAKGQLTFKSWGIGDSEINYNREFLLDNNVVSGTSKILRPKDRNPNLKYFVHTGGTTPLVNFGANDVRCIKAIINNEADERGHFSGDLSSGFTTNVALGEAYIRSYGVIDYTSFSGGTLISMISGATQNGDFILFKLGYSDFTNEVPTPHLWFKVQSSVANGGNQDVTLDRNLPTLSSGDVSYIVYKGGEIYDNEPDAVSYWDTGTLSFDSSCDITVLDVPIWNMNNVFSESILGITGTTEYEKYTQFGSYDYLGEKNNFLYSATAPFKKAIGIIHYSNKTISNLYGEYFYIDTVSKTVKIHLPDLMYHRRYFAGGSESADKMGMTFLASGTTGTVDSNGLNYTPLIEDPTLVAGTPLAIGRVYPDLELIVIDDAEILAALSYKSNRNWTLPALELLLVNPTSGTGTGPLKAGETIYVTYSINNTTGAGITSSLPCQTYATITNTSTSTRDIQFNINDLGLFPYMRSNTNSGGFYGNEFKVMYQITTGDRPLTGSWKVLNFSASVSGTTGIDVGKLETQNPLVVNVGSPIFQLSQINTSSATTYSIIESLSMASSSSPDILQFGDERFFYGNVEAFIGATIYKTLFNININASNFNKTTNISRSSDPTTNPPLIKVSEVGIYDNDGDLVIISKLSNPIKLTPGSSTMIELSIDF